MSMWQTNRITNECAATHVKHTGVSIPDIIILLFTLVKLMKAECVGTNN